ncbi:copper amine oxidase [Gautieria morchelliformis]|nr:copper amine oxidase [Gautieria morchelliformis]
MVDSLRNSVIESDTVPLLNAPTGSADNWAGNALIMQEHTLHTTLEAPEMMTLPKIDVGVSGKPMGYVLGYKGATTTLLAAPGSWVIRRAMFAGKRCGPRDDVPQTMDPPSDSVEKWANEEESIDDDDIFLFITMGVNHIPRPEYWPVFHLEIGVPDYKLWNLKAGCNIVVVTMSGPRPALGDSAGSEIPVSKAFTSGFFRIFDGKKR